MIEECDAKSVTQLVEQTNKLRDNDWQKWQFRGQANEAWGLKPAAGRENDFNDRKAFRMWLRHARPYFDQVALRASEAELLAVAQHHGLHTRLLDWTFNPLAAAFFAASKEDFDGVVWCHYTDSDTVDPENVGTWENLVALQNFRRLRPSSLTARIARQGGLFTIHNDPRSDLRVTLPKTDRLVRLRIPKEEKRAMLFELSNLAVNSMALFPDLDGVSKHMNYVFMTMPYTPKAADSLKSMY